MDSLFVGLGSFATCALLMSTAGANPSEHYYQPEDNEVIPRRPILPPLAAFSTKHAILKAHLYTLIEPIAVGIVGIIIFLLIKNLAIPYLSILGKHSREMEHSLSMDPDTETTILNIVHKGLCLERIACQLGAQAKDYTLTTAALRAIKESRSKGLLTIFSAAAEGNVSRGCDVYRCKH